MPFTKKKFTNEVLNEIKQILKKEKNIPLYKIATKFKISFADLKKHLE